MNEDRWILRMLFYTDWNKFLLAGKESNKDDTASVYPQSDLTRGTSNMWEYRWKQCCVFCLFSYKHCAEKKLYEKSFWQEVKLFVVVAMFTWWANKDFTAETYATVLRRTKNNSEKS